jgi:hypothetical protein
VIVMFEPFPASEVRLAISLVQASHQLDAALLEQQDIQPIGHQAIGQQNISRAKHIPKLTEQAHFALTFSGIAAHAEIQDGSAS